MSKKSKDFITAKPVSGTLTTNSLQRSTSTRTFRGGLDEISPDDIVYGEFATGLKQGPWIDVVYLDADILRSFSGPVSLNHRLVNELKILLRDDSAFYVVPIKEVPLGFAFKHTDVVNIAVTSLVEGNGRHAPSCVWKMSFKDGSARTLEAEYQAYFAYGNIIRPKSMSNASVLDKVFDDSLERS